MLFFIFCIYVNARKNICICNKICSPLCSSNTFIGSKFDSNLFKLLKTESTDDNEIEIIFYSRTKDFNFIFDSNYLERKELILTALSDSKPIIIRFQKDLKISNELIILYPNYQLFLSPYSNNYTNIKQITNPHYSNLRSNLLETISPAQATGNYSNQDYLNKNKISTTNFTYSSLGDQNNHPISYAFDDYHGTYWVSSIITNKTTTDSIFINFTYYTCIEAIIVFPAYSTRGNLTFVTRRYDGYPVSFNILSSLKDDEYKLNYVINGKPKDTDIWSLVQFVFPHPICCDNLKLEFTEVTPNFVFSNNETKACIGDFYLIKSQIPTPSFSKLPTPSQSPSSTPTIKPTSSDSQSPTYDETISPAQATGNYSNLDYLINNKISTTNFVYSSLGDQNNHQISNAFDGDQRTYWVSSIITNETTTDSIFINFTYYTCIEAIIIYPAYSTIGSMTPMTRHYDGYPVSFNILSSKKDDEYELNYVVNGRPKDTDIWEFIQFVFPHEICCDNLKLEFTEVTQNSIFSNNETKACIGDFYLIQSQTQTPSQSQNQNDMEFSTAFIDEDYDNKDTKQYSISEEMKISKEIDFDPSFHITSTKTHSNDKSKENSKQKKVTNKTFIVMIVIAVEILLVIIVVISILAIIIRNKDIIFLNEEDI